MFLFLQPLPHRPHRPTSGFRSAALRNAHLKLITIMSAAVAAPTLFEETSTSKGANAVDTLCLDPQALDLTQKPTESSSLVVAAEKEDVDDSRQRFVGDVELDEKDEPLLKESKRRFVLFPIQYNEVRTTGLFRLFEGGRPGD